MGSGAAASYTVSIGLNESKNFTKKHKKYEKHVTGTK
jgi:hypothetical protein